MGYKMKGFSGFKDSPAKATDAGLTKAADLMDRGLTDPTSLIGEGAKGFLEGFKKSYKPETRSQVEIEQKKKEDQAKKEDKKKQREPVIEVELPTVTEFNEINVENKPIVTEEMQKKKKK